jgi:hypothetical protein
MNDAKYIGMDVHQTTISVAVRVSHVPTFESRTNRILSS